MLASCLSLQIMIHLRLARQSAVKTVPLLSLQNQRFIMMRERADRHYYCLHHTNNHFDQPKSVPAQLKNGAKNFSSGRNKAQGRKQHRVQFPKFIELTNLHPLSKLALERAGLKRMTEIQSETWEHALQGKDIIGRARTGTGKTMAFLLPAFERVLQKPIDKTKVSILVLSPNRELAMQTAEQANLLSRPHDGGMSCLAIVGGTNAKRDIEKLTRQGLPTVIVATPGRLLSHLKRSYVGDVPFSECFGDLRVLVIDEADTMLDLGFRDALVDILSYCPPPEKRQTMLFSATLDDATDLAQYATKSDYVLIDCVGDEEKDAAGQSTIPIQVNQSYVIVPQSRVFSAPIEILLGLMDNARIRKHKIIAFFPTINQVRLYESIFNSHLGRRVFVIHSEMDQSARSCVRNLFQHSFNAILLTTDASARGLDYKDVSHVIQFGMAYDKKAYIHRLGRTARAGKGGEGILVLTPLERTFLDMSLEGLDVKHDASFQSLFDGPLQPDVDDELAHLVAEVRNGNDRDLKRSVGNACKSMLAYYQSRRAVLGSDSKETGTKVEDSLLEMASAFLQQAGISSRLRMDVPTKKNWSPGDGFDVGRPFNPSHADAGE